MVGGWIGRRTPNSWPLNSPDITPLDFSPRCYVKNLVYQGKNNDLQRLKYGAKDAVHTIIHSILRNTWTEVAYRLKIRRDVILNSTEAGSS
jgi:hypothetical protein